MEDPLLTELKSMRETLEDVSETLAKIARSQKKTKKIIKQYADTKLINKSDDDDYWSN